MGISMGKTGRGDISDPNMTPMIDVLLVLIVIFIIAQPMMQKTMDIQLPREEKNQPPNPNNTNIVLSVEPNGVYKINTLQVSGAQLQQKLNEIYANRPQKIIFVKAGPDVIYQDVIGAMDAARGAGVKVIGAVLPSQESQMGLSVLSIVGKKTGADWLPFFLASARQPPDRQTLPPKATPVQIINHDLRPLLARVDHPKYVILPNLINLHLHRQLDVGHHATVLIKNADECHLVTGECSHQP